MTGLAGWLTRVPVILGLLIAMVFIGMRFAPLQQTIDGPLLDMIMTGQAAKARLAEMTDAQRTAHFWGTLINDTLYPIAYGGFLAGLAGRLAPGRWCALAMVPAFVTVLLDICENTVQMLALTGTADLLAAKTVLTPLKFGFFLISAVLAAGLALAALVRWISHRKET